MTDNPIKLLVVDDEEAIREVTEEYFMRKGYEVYTAENGADALDIINEVPQIACIFTDINIPKLNGLDLIERIRKEDSQTPIVILSAYTKNEYLLKAVELHLVTYLIKPISTQKLQETIKKVLTQIDNNILVSLNNGYFWDTKKEKLFFQQQEIILSSYEKLFISCLYKNINNCVSYIDLHIAVNPSGEFSKNSLTSLIKRLRQTTSKDFIESCYMEGYKISI
jgi:DNA-binding response OmpR family regulator